MFIFIFVYIFLLFEPFTLAVTGNACSDSISSFLISLEMLDSPYSGSTTNTFDSAISLDCGGNQASETIYSWIIPVNNTFNVWLENISSQFNSIHELRIGDSCPGDTVIKCIDSLDARDGALITWVNDDHDVNERTVYLIVDGYRTGDVGSYDVVWEILDSCSRRLIEEHPNCNGNLHGDNCTFACPYSGSSSLDDNCKIECSTDESVTAVCNDGDWVHAQKCEEAKKCNTHECEFPLFSNPAAEDCLQTGCDAATCCATASASSKGFDVARFFIIFGIILGCMLCCGIIFLSWLYFLCVYHCTWKNLCKDSVFGCFCRDKDEEKQFKQKPITIGGCFYRIFC